MPSISNAQDGGARPASADASTMPIAVIGMSCRLPGDATSPEKLWELCVNGRSAWSKVPADRFNQEAFYHPVAEHRITTNVTGGHFLKEDLALFDAAFFNMTSEMAATMDPQMRLQMESVFEALESAGLPIENVAGSNTSVYAGAFFRDYMENHMRDPQTFPRYVMTGNGNTMMSNRISHFFDLRGPSLTVDTGCSTGLVALHQACQSLRTGESSTAIVAGANIILNPDVFVLFSSLGFLSPDGKSYSFDSRANGYGRGEGVGTLIIKPLHDALRDGDPVRAVIRQTAVNQDGKTTTITSPSQEAQIELIRSCYKSIGLNAADTSYVEAHGTGTQAGDPIEATAIGTAFGEGRPADRPTYIGSVKSNIGHLETSSGFAAIIKAVLAVEKGLIPPSINYESPNKKIDLDKLKLRIPTKATPWPKGFPVRASINNFGYGGTNAHVILESLESWKSHQAVSSTNNTATNGTYTNGVHANGILTNGVASDGIDTSADSKSQVFVLSAKDEVTIKSMLTRLSTHIDEPGYSQEKDFLSNLAYTLGQRRSRFQWRAALAAHSTDSLRDALKETKPVRSSTKPRLGYVFTGQGAQWYGMGRELIAAYPVFRKAIQECDSNLKTLGAPWSLMEELNKSEQDSKVNDIAYSPPLCIAVQIALTDLLRSWGVEATAVTSHSSGEVAAAHAAGAITTFEAMAIVYLRTPYLQALQEKKAEGRGAMIAVGLGREEAQDYCSNLTSGKAVIACVNSPSSVTVSGDLSAVDELEGILSQKKIFARKLKVNVAFHSHHMVSFSKPYLASLRKLLHPQVEFNQASFHSPVTGGQILKAEDLGPEHWLTNTVSPVLFQDALVSMCLGNTAQSNTEKQVDILVELGPHSALAGPIRQTMTLPELKEAGIIYSSCLERGKDAVQTLHNLASFLLRNGFPVNLGAINSINKSESLHVLHNLPMYPWNHRTAYWTESQLNRNHRLKKHANHDLLGSRMVGTNKLSPTWRHIIRATDVPWVRDHTVQSSIVYPGAGYISMATEAMRQIADADKPILGYEFRDIAIMAALVIPETSDGQEVHLSLQPCGDKMLENDWQEFSIRSTDGEDNWTEHCKGLLSLRYREANHNSPTFCQDQDGVDLRTLIAPDEVYTDSHNPEETFAALRKLGVNHGPIFRNLISAQLADDRSTTVHQIPNTAELMPGKYEQDHLIHPTTLDSLIVGAYTTLPNGGSKENMAMIPKSIASVWISNELPRVAGACLKSYNKLERHSRQGFQSSMAVVGESSKNSLPLLQINGLFCQSIGVSATSTEEAEAPQALSIHWEQSLALTDLRALQKSLTLAADAVESVVESRLRLAVLYLIQDALHALQPSDTDGLLWYHQLFHDWMQSQHERGSAILKQANLSEAEKLQLYRVVAEESINGKLVCRIGKQLIPILRSEVDPMSIAAEDKLLDKYYTTALRTGRSYSQVNKLIHLYSHSNPGAKILEIGASTSGCTRGVLETLGGNGSSPRFAQYDLTDTSSNFLEQAQAAFGDWGNHIQYKKLDIESDPEEQGFENEAYDLIIACQSLHKSKSVETTMTHVRKLLKSKGKLIIIEMTNDAPDVPFVFGTLPDWWMSEEEERELSPLLTVERWNQVLSDTGFNGCDLQVRDSRNSDQYVLSVMMATAGQEEVAEYHPNVLLCYPGTAPPEPWIDILRNDIQSMTSSPIEIASLLKADFEDKVCVFFDNVEQPILTQPSPDDFAAIKQLALSAKGVLWVSCGATIDCARPHAGAHTGFLRALRVENMTRRYISLDIDMPTLWTIGTRQIVSKVYEAAFNYTLESKYIDTEYAVSRGQILVPRLKQNPAQTNVLSGYSSIAPTERQPFSQPKRELRMVAETPGMIDSLCFRDDPEANLPLPDDFVDIEPQAFGLNFRDVMVAMGQLDREIMGCECSGIIRRLGSKVPGRLKVGDRVCAVLRGHWQTSVRVHHTSVVSIPDDMSIEVAASIPTVFLTAYYCLFSLGRLEKNERVLIHAAAGGVGQAAIMLAKHAEAEIFVTVGSQEKRKFVHETYGIAHDHILSSRDTSFAAKVLEMTDGEGVDVVLNSLAGALLKASWDCIAMFGRFVEIGKRDMEANKGLQMAPFKRNASFSSFDLLLLGEFKGKIVSKIFPEVMQLFQDGKIRPVGPLTVYPVSDVKKAFRFMQGGKHLGKIVVTTGRDDLVDVSTRRVACLSPNASYLIVGGVGGIGSSIARRLVRLGAKNLVLISRNAEAAKNATFVKHLQKLGCHTVARNCDVTNAEDVRKLVDWCSGSMPPIKGLIQAAMVLQDSILERMTYEKYMGAVLPKVSGTWNLHKSLLPVDLSFFVTLASISGIAGNPSQTNYAAGNTFEDAVVRYRTSKGLPAVSLDLAPVLSVGVVSQQGNLAENLSKVGFTALEEESVLQLVEAAIADPLRDLETCQVVTGVSSASGGRWENALFKDNPMFSVLKAAQSSQSGADVPKPGVVDLKRSLASAKTLTEATETVCAAISQKLSDMFSIPVEEIDAGSKMASFGVDSLVAVELRNWLSGVANAEVSIFDMMQSPSLTALSQSTAKKSKYVGKDALKA